MSRALVAAALSALFLASSARAPAAVVDRTVARFTDPEAGDASSASRFVMMRELLVETWLASYERAPLGVPSYDEKLVRVALERHVIEAVLSGRPLPAAAEARVAKATEDARLSQIVALGGEARLQELIARATGVTGGEGSATEKQTLPELDAILRRRARAEVYIETAVAQLVDPTEGELRAAQAKLPAVAKVPFEQAAPGIRAFLRTARLRESSVAYYQAIRSKVRLEIVPEP